MSRHTRNPFTKVSKFFKEHFGLSRSTSGPSNADPPSAGPAPTLTSQISTPLSSSNVDVPSAVPTQPQSLALSPSRPSDSSTTPMHTPSPAFPPPQVPTPSISQPPSDLLLPSLASDPACHPLLLPASRAPTPQLGGPTFFTGAHGFSISNSQFNDFSLVGSGIDKLLKNSMPDAFYNSAARYPPPKCHLGTREEYIAKITNWALGNSDHSEPILWMRGPFGIGKSAVAQSCAEALDAEEKLVATLFFSRSNTDRDDPRRVFTSIAFQIATKCESFSNIIDTRIRKDPSLTTKSLSVQFKELLVRPLSQVDIASSGIDGCVVIIDGLDECRGSSEQCEIIRVIAASARERTTPFRWFITSRPEDLIIRTMKSSSISSVSFHLELPVSREIDHEILLYLTDEFNGIRESHGLADYWPSEEVLSLLVERAAGLWIYVTTIVRFIADENSYGPEYQLRLVLQFAKDVSTKAGVDNPLAEMDFLYTLIMQRVPERLRKTVRDLLLIRSAVTWKVNYIVAALGLSEEQVRRSCASIQSVMELQGSDLESMHLHFYHASFLDFMQDPTRSKEFCIYGSFLIDNRRERLEWLHQVCSRSIGPSDIIFPSEVVLVQGWDRNKYYSYNLMCFLHLCGVPNHPLDLPTATSFQKLQFRTMLRLIGGVGSYGIFSRTMKQFRDNLPTELCDKIMREGQCPIPGCRNTETVWILGHGENETVTE